MYRYIVQDQQVDPIAHVYLACCYFYLGMYKEADEAAQKGNFHAENKLPLINVPKFSN